VGESQDGRLVASTGFSVIRAKGATDARFLAHVILSDPLFAQARRAEVGSNYPAVNESDVKQFLVPCPPLDQQRRIAEILDACDAAIHWTEGLIAKLVRMEQGLLHDLMTLGIDEGGNVRDSIAHPDGFGATPLGIISRALTVRRVGALLARRPKNGHSPPEADTWTGTWMLGLGCLTSSGFAPRQLKAAPRDDAALVPALLRDGDLLMSRSNTREMVGLVGRYRDVGAPCTYPDLMMRLVPNQEVSAAFLELALRSHSSRRQIQSMASGTSGSMVKIGAATVMRLMVAVPARDEQERIVERFAAISERIAREADSLRKVRLVKSGVMDDLLTGRVRVDAEEDVT
jgi:type I restriction enzyme S subunit